MIIATGFCVMRLLWLISHLLSIAISQAVTSEPWSLITAFPEYTFLRPCAAECLYKDCGSEPSCDESIDRKLNCKVYECICQQDKVSSASAPISSCVMSSCSTKVDADMAWAAFTSYCYAKWPALPATPTSPPSSSSSETIPEGYGTFVTKTDGQISPVFPITSQSGYGTFITGTSGQISPSFSASSNLASYPSTATASITSTGRTSGLPSPKPHSRSASAKTLYINIGVFEGTFFSVAIITLGYTWFLRRNSDTIPPRIVHRLLFVKAD